MAAVLEGCLNDIPSIGFSLLDFSSKADFSACIPFVRFLAEKTLINGMPADTCLNVNIPKGSYSEINGIRVCRQTKGVWHEEFEKRTDPNNHDYYWLTGKFYNHEPMAEDTDEWALKHQFVSVVPVQADMTAYSSIPVLQSWELDKRHIGSVKELNVENRTN
jgi:5'-nucleotidase